MNNEADPVVEETRAVRRELTERFGDNIDALCDFLAAREAEHGERLVNRPSKSPQTVGVDGRRK